MAKRSMGKTLGRPEGPAPAAGHPSSSYFFARPLTARERTILVFILAAMLAVRVAYVVLAPAAPVSSDASGYDAAARRLVATGSYAFPIGRGLWADDRVREDSLATFFQRPPNAWSMPGYSLWVAGVYGLFGTGPDRFVPVRVLQAVMSLARMAKCFWIAWRVLGNRAAWLTLGVE